MFNAHRRSHTNLSLAALSAIPCLIGATSAFAQVLSDTPPETPASPTSSGSSATTPSETSFGSTQDSASAKSALRVDLTLWAWLTAINGTVGAKGFTADVDASFSDIVNDSDSIVALAGRFELGYGKFAVYADGFYSDLGVDNATGPLGEADVEVSMQQAIVDFGLMYRLVDKKSTGGGAESRRNFALDLYAGARYSDVDVAINPARLDTRSDDESWFDPIVGARVILPFAKQWNMSVNGDIGGFGVSSEFTWSATAIVGYDFHIFKAPATVYLGYRAIDWDYTNGSGRDEFTWDVIQHGPLLGLSIQF
jgi:hypothetical protein